jgi:cardiolipin synthase A/B
MHAGRAPAAPSATRYDVDVAVSSRAAGPRGSGDLLLDQAFTRVAGARATGGNRVQLLRDGRENYPAWLQAIAGAQTSVHFETYIVHDDRMGQQFAAALRARAAARVRVRVLYDWWGARGATGSRFWRELAEAGVDVRSFNAPRLDSPFGWISRDHRKCLVVDGRVAFVSGLCVGDAWVGDPSRGIEAWRDTGVAIEGPAVADIDRAFAGTWALAGPPLPPNESATGHNSAPATDLAGQALLRVVATEPSLAGLFKLDHIVVAAAERSLWLTDAYFVAVTSYVQALCAAAADGVDVRLLLPGASDIPGLRALSRAGYRPLLEGGVRVFEWNGPMLHAKTAVADGRWARVGSTNLNPASWLGNWELDVAVEDADFARAMESMYEDDLRRATEIVLSGRRRMRAASTAAGGSVLPRRRSGRRAAAGAIGLGSTIGAAITGRRPLGPAEARVLASAGGILVALAAAIVWWPKLAAVPLAVAAVWIALSLILKAWKLHRAGRRRQRVSPGPGARGSGPD